MYLYGGSDGSSQSTIYSASVSDPTTWTDTGYSLPEVRDSMGIYVDANFVYLYGGANTTGALTTTSTIFTAPIATPTIFTTSGSTLYAGVGGNPANGGPGVVVAGNNLYLPGQYASITDPLTWTPLPSAVQLATGVMANSVAVVGSKVYSFGGLTGGGTASSVIQSASTNTPSIWSNESNTLVDAFYGGQIIKTSKYLYLIGGVPSLGKYYRALLTSPTSWSLVDSSGPDVVFGKAFITDDQVWYWGGVSNSSAASVGDGWRASIVDGEIIGWKKNPALSNITFRMASFTSSFAMIKAGDYVYAVGGRGPLLATNYIIQRCHVNDLTSFTGSPSSWRDVGNITNSSLCDPSVVVLNNKVYLIGGDALVAGSGGWLGSSTSILSADMSDLANGYASFVEESGGFIQTNGIGRAPATCINDIVYLLGGRTTTTTGSASQAIFRTVGSATHLLAYPRVPESTASLPTIEVKTGALGSYSSFQRTGMLPWLVSDK
ncbi:unnamed protein product [Sphagnum jensenii]